MLTKQRFDQLIEDVQRANHYEVITIEMSRRSRKALSQGTHVELNPRGDKGIPVLLGDLGDDTVVLTIKEEM